MLYGTSAMNQSSSAWNLLGQTWSRRVQKTHTFAQSTKLKASRNTREEESAGYKITHKFSVQLIYSLLRWQKLTVLTVHLNNIFNVLRTGERIYQTLLLMAHPVSFTYSNCYFVQNSFKHVPSKFLAERHLVDNQLFIKYALLNFPQFRLSDAYLLIIVVHSLANLFYLIPCYGKTQSRGSFRNFYSHLFLLGLCS